MIKCMDGKIRWIGIDKWINICKDSSSNSKIYVLHAADDYSTERRLITHYNHFKNDKCIFSSI